jgi:hypothetical protein
MQQTQEPVLDDSDLKALAKFFDALLEIDFELNRDEGLIPNAC